MRKKLTINKQWIKQFSPCKDRWLNYLKYYSKWEGSLLDFMYLRKISDEDKIWIFTQEIKELERAQRRFAVYCMDRCQTESKEISEYQILIQIMYEFTNYDNITELKDDEYKAANRAAYRTANWDTDLAANWTACRAANWASYRTANWAADLAANRAAYRTANWAANWASYPAVGLKLQIEIIKYVLFWEGK